MGKYISRALIGAVVGILLYAADFSETLPNEIILFSGRPQSTTFVGGVKISSFPESIGASADTIVADEGEYEAKLSVLGGIAAKNVSLKVVPPKTLEAVGELVGIKLRGAGVIVIGFADFYRDCGLEQGDVIAEVNGREINSYKDFSAAVRGDESVSLGVIRGENRLSLVAEPVIGDDGEPKLGVWVRDSAAGVGTMTFIDDETGIYGALGHGINESDTGVRFPVRKGTVEKTFVASVTKGIRGTPGEITGAFAGKTLGTIEINSECGIFGQIISSELSGESYPVGLAGEIEVGEAEIICDAGEGRSRYKINIMRVNRLGSVSKGIFLEITDERLLTLTGGIVQGMSGSPIIQNGKIIGAVTHVLVNDPTCGYGVFIENMLECAEAPAE